MPADHGSTITKSTSVTPRLASAARNCGERIERMIGPARWTSRLLRGNASGQPPPDNYRSRGGRRCLQKSAPRKERCIAHVGCSVVVSHRKPFIRQNGVSRGTLRTWYL